MMMSRNAGRLLALAGAVAALSVVLAGAASRHSCALTRGVIVDGQLSIVNEDRAPEPRYEYVAPVAPTLRLEIIRPRPRSWDPEPESCPRGVKVMRYGRWGC